MSIKPFVCAPCVYRLLLLFALMLPVEKTAFAQTRLNLKQPEDAVKAMQKTQCSLNDGEAAVYWWKGRVFSRVAGERDRHMFNVEGMNIRACQAVQDNKRGYGYRMVSREILLYLDPATNQVLRGWKNPFTGQRNQVIQIANDPVNNPPTFAYGADGKPYQFNGTSKNGRVWLPLEIPLFYKNPLGGEYQDYVGGTYHAMEMFTFFMHEQELLDANKTTSDDVTVTWARTSEWLPWMEMGDRPGMLVFTAIGRKLAKWQDLSPLMKTEIEAHYPSYKTPPPLNDNRPNETSWTYFKKVLSTQPTQANAQPAKRGTKPVSGASIVPELSKLQPLMKCPTDDGKPAYAWWQGRAISRVPGERDRFLFNVQVLNVSACQKQGAEWRKTAREIWVFTDLATGQILRSWKNPWTGETVEVVPDAYDPLNESGFHAPDATALGFVKDGRALWMSEAQRQFAAHPLGGEFQKYIGGWLHSLDVTVAETALANLQQAAFDADRVQMRVRVSKWLPWMKMGDRPGALVLHTGGMQLQRWEEVPEILRSEIQQNWPLWQTAPAFDDKRPNAVGGELFKRWLSEKKK